MGQLVLAGACRETVSCRRDYPPNCGALNAAEKCLQSVSDFFVLWFKFSVLKWVVASLKKQRTLNEKKKKGTEKIHNFRKQLNYCSELWQK